MYVKQNSPNAGIEYNFNGENFPGCPHGSFKLEEPPDSVPPRRSVEVRAMIFSKP